MIVAAVNADPLTDPNIRRVLSIHIEDYPLSPASQNARNWRLTADERDRNRQLGKACAMNALRPYDDCGLPYLRGELAAFVSIVPPEGRHLKFIHDTLNVAGMLKGYFDGFTDAGAWDDDWQITRLEVVQYLSESSRVGIRLGSLSFFIEEI